MLFIKLILLLTLLGPSNNKWQRVETNCDISFLFPNNPQKLQRLAGNIPSIIYQTKDLTCVLGVVCSDFSSKHASITGGNAKSLYEELKKGSINMETAVLKNEKTIPYDNMIIKEIEYSIIKDNFEMTYFKRFIFRDNFIYQISIGGRTRHLDFILQEKDIFFNSIIFSDKQPATPNNK